MVLVTYSFFESHYKSSRIFTAEILQDIKLIFPTQRCIFKYRIQSLYVCRFVAHLNATKF